jgi:hypothetical protein
MNVNLTKTPVGFIPADSESGEWANKIKIGQVVHADFKRMRNYKFHKKLFALLNLAYEYWQPGEINSEYGIPEKSFERFRKDLTILAGYYHVEHSLSRKHMRIEADSISFAKMDNETFEKLYNSILGVITKKILPNMSRDEIETLTDKFLEFV